MDKDSRKQLGSQNREWGKQAEQIAFEYFLKQGYVILERNWKLGKIEIDVILRKDRTVVFVEVKARAHGNNDPVDAVTTKKRSLMIKGADVYLRQLPYLYAYRFDIFTVTGNASDYEICHYPDAFMPPVNGGRMP